jgi:hypothetical protein
MQWLLRTNNFLSTNGFSKQRESIKITCEVIESDYDLIVRRHQAWVS